MRKKIMTGSPCKVYKATIDDAEVVPLYHATMAKMEICKAGFKMHDELDEKKRGLGGMGASKLYTSFTASKDIAAGIAKDLKTAIAISNGVVVIRSLPGFMDDVDRGYCSTPSLVWKNFEGTRHGNRVVSLHEKGFEIAGRDDKRVQEKGCFRHPVATMDDWTACFPGRDVKPLVVTPGDGIESAAVEFADGNDEKRNLYKIFKSFLAYRDKTATLTGCHVNPRFHDSVTVDNFKGMDMDNTGVVEIHAKLPVPASIIQKMFKGNDITREEADKYWQGHRYMDGWYMGDLETMIGKMEGEPGHASADADHPLQEILVDPGRLDGEIRVLDV